jgi:hypothetical protein
MNMMLSVHTDWENLPDFSDFICKSGKDSSKSSVFFGQLFWELFNTEHQ